MYPDKNNPRWCDIAYDASLCLSQKHDSSLGCANIAGGQSQFLATSKVAATKDMALANTNFKLRTASNIVPFILLICSPKQHGKHLYSELFSNILQPKIFNTLFRGNQSLSNIILTA